MILIDRLGPDNFSTLQIKGHVLHHARAHLKVPVWLLIWNALLTKKLPMFLSRLNEITSTNQQIVKSTINDLIVKQELPATATNLIIITPRTSCIYFLPKIHKPNNPGRPIVSACSFPTKLISSYLDKIMAPIVRSLPSYVKDSQHALETSAFESLYGG